MYNAKTPEMYQSSDRSAVFVLIVWVLFLSLSSLQMGAHLSSGQGCNLRSFKCDFGLRSQQFNHCALGTCQRPQYQFPLAKPYSLQLIFEKDNTIG
jgi:hypothetical protein